MTLNATRSVNQFLILFAVIITISANTIIAQRERTSFNDNWLFQKDDAKGSEGILSYPNIKDWVRSTGNEFVLTSKAIRSPRPAGNLGDNIAYTRTDLNDSTWRKLNLPHDWAIEGDFVQDLPGETGKRPYAGVGWYRKHFQITEKDKGRQIYLDIDGAMAYPTVWLNGQFVGGWAYGYSSFRLDLTPYIKIGGENVIAIRLENLPESSRWYPGSGIYRNVWLVKTDPVHVGQWGTFVTTPVVNKDSASVKIGVTIDNNVGNYDIAVRTLIYRLSNGKRSLKSIASSEYQKIGLELGKNFTSTAEISIRQPALWSTKTPYLYMAVTTIQHESRVIDTYETIFGIRTVQFDAQKGFVLNGERVYMKGVCQHHDLGSLGAAVNYRALERQLEILKEMGVNAIRTSHNPPAPELLELTDRMGFVVIDEAFDAWGNRKKINDYHLIYEDWHEKDLRSMIRRDRNHPSVVIWSSGNEISEQRNVNLHYRSIDLTKITHEEDPTRLVMVGANHVEAGYNGFQKTIDVFGYNYKPQEYAKFRAANPTMPLIGSETASTISSRGEYFFPVVEDKSKGQADFQMSSYDLYAPRWATPPDPEFEGQDRNPFVAGEFVWTGFDYLGEPTPYNADSSNILNFSDPADQARMAEELKAIGKIKVPSRSSYFGIVDLTGFKKDRFYIYQARWRSELPMAHILPHWNWPERVGQVTPVHVYTSGDEAELFLNGKSLGRKKRGEFQYRFRWDDVVYQPGELKVVTYKNGKFWAAGTVKTTDTAAMLQMQADRSTISSDVSDLSFITVKIDDKNGLNVPRSKNMIRFEISGPGEIVATDNGDATDLSSFQSTSRKAFNGLALVIVRSIKGRPGKITVKAASDGLRGSAVTINAR